MRDITFRGKRTDNGRWVEGDLLTGLTPKNSEEEMPAIKSLGGDIGIFFVDEDTVGQFTGLFDCTGADIYEGDIVGLTEYFITPNELDAGTNTAVVTYQNGEFIAKRVNTNYHIGIAPKECLVIGNIHDNPGLLKLDKQ